MPFGKHQGMELAEIPDHYLRWLRGQPWLRGPLVDEVNRVLGIEPEGTEVEALPEMDEIEQADSFSVHYSGDGIQRICDQDGAIIAETTDPRVAQVICRLLNNNNNEELLYDYEEH